MKKIWKYTLIGGGIGIIIGYILFMFAISSFTFFSFESKQLFYHSFLYPYLYWEGVCRSLNLENGWGCLGYNFIGGIISYGIIGLLAGILIYIFQKLIKRK